MNLNFAYLIAKVNNLQVISHRSEKNWGHKMQLNIVSNCEK